MHVYTYSLYIYIQTAEKVVEARKTQTKMEDQLLFSQKKADADLRERKCKLTVARTKLQRTRYVHIVEYLLMYVRIIMHTTEMH